MAKPLTKVAMWTTGVLLVLPPVVSAASEVFTLATGVGVRHAGYLFDNNEWLLPLYTPLGVATAAAFALWVAVTIIRVVPHRPGWMIPASGLAAALVGVLAYPLYLAGVVGAASAEQLTHDTFVKLAGIG